jgi:hypothetical protein
MRKFNLPLAPLGDFDTLSERLRAEVAASNSGHPFAGSRQYLGSQTTCRTIVLV